MTRINKSKKCQALYPNCLGVAQFQHILKLGAVQLDKQWVCSNCKQTLQAKK